MPSGASQQVALATPVSPSSWGQRGKVGPVFAGNIKTRDIGYDIDQKTLLSNINIELKAGEISCLLGPSGCGKSSLLRIIAGLVPQTRGEILMDGVEIAGLNAFVAPEKRNIGLMFQDFALFPHLTVLENVIFGLYALSRQDAIRTAEQALSRVGLLQLRDAYPATLSGGEQQRVALARTIVPRPQVVLMDEPFSGLDQRLREVIRAETIAVLREMRATVLLVTHDPQEAFEIADHIILMRQGRIVQTGGPYELHDHPANLEAARFFSNADEFEAKVFTGHAQTPLGKVATPHVADGTKVTVVLRPGAIIATNSPAGVQGRIVSAQRQGRGLICKVQLEGQTSTITARFEGLGSVAIGDIRRFELHHDHVMVFEMETGEPIL